MYFNDLNAAIIGTEMVAFRRSRSELWSVPQRVTYTLRQLIQADQLAGRITVGEQVLLFRTDGDRHVITYTDKGWTHGDIH